MRRADRDSFLTGHTKIMTALKTGDHAKIMTTRLGVVIIPKNIISYYIKKQLLRICSLTL